MKGMQKLKKYSLQDREESMTLSSQISGILEE